MAAKPLLDEILRLPPDERLRLVEDIWDSLAQTTSQLPLPDWHRAELDRRLADRTEQATIGWADVRSRFRRAAG